jgi:hypothetical protein
MVAEDVLLHRVLRRLRQFAGISAFRLKRPQVELVAAGFGLRDRVIYQPLLGSLECVDSLPVGV